MPIGIYPTFDACVKANRNKKDPHAYCAVIERTIKERRAKKRKKRKSKK